MKMYENLKPSQNSRLSNPSLKKGIMGTTDRTNAPQKSLSPSGFAHYGNNEAPNISNIVNSAIASPLHHQGAATDYGPASKLAKAKGKKHHEVATGFNPNSSLAHRGSTGGTKSKLKQM